MPKRKNFKCRALSCTFTRTHLEGRRSVELMKLSFKPVRASRAAGLQGPYGGSQLVLTLYRMYFFCFQMCNRLPEMMKNGDAGIFPVYYSLKGAVYTVWIFTGLCVVMRWDGITITNGMVMGWDGMGRGISFPSQATIPSPSL